MSGVSRPLPSTVGLQPKTRKRALDLSNDPNEGVPAAKKRRISRRRNQPTLEPIQILEDATATHDDFTARTDLAFQAAVNDSQALTALYAEYYEYIVIKCMFNAYFQYAEFLHKHRPCERTRQHIQGPETYLKDFEGWLRLFDRSHERDSSTKINEAALYKDPEKRYFTFRNGKSLTLGPGATYEKLRWNKDCNIIQGKDLRDLFGLLDDIASELDKYREERQAGEPMLPKYTVSVEQHRAAFFLCAFYVGYGDGLSSKNPQSYYDTKIGLWKPALEEFLKYDMVEIGSCWLSGRRFCCSWRDFMMGKFEDDGIDVKLLESRWRWHHPGDHDYESQMSRRHLTAKPSATNVNQISPWSSPASGDQ